MSRRAIWPRVFPYTGALFASRARPPFRTETADDLDDRPACRANPTGLYPEQYAGWWRVWLRYGFVVLLAGIAAGGTVLKMRPSSLPIAPVTSEVGATPKTTTFPSLLTADLPRMGWRNPEVEKMRGLLKSRPRTPKPDTAHHKRLPVHH
jgi:hypothetical protein